MAFIADLSKLIERGTLDINGPINHSQSSPSIDIPIGDIYWIDGYRLECGKDGWLKEGGRTLLGEAEYIAFTNPISLLPDYELYIDPRSSLARLGLQVTKFENDFLSKVIDPKRLPEYNGRIPLVVRTMRTNLFLPEGLPALQVLVAEKGTCPLGVEQLVELCKNHQVEVLREGKEIEPQNDEFSLTFHTTVKRYEPSTRILTPYENTGEYFQTFDLSYLLHEEPSLWTDSLYQWSLIETCFYLGSTAETIKIGNRHLGMLTHSYPHKWHRIIYRDRPTLHVSDRWRWRGEIVEEWVEPSGYVHLTPWIKPGSDGTQTLEIASKILSHNRILVRPGDSACSLKIFELDEECNPYTGRYRGQEGPSVSRLYQNK